MSEVKKPENTGVSNKNFNEEIAKNLGKSRAKINQKSYQIINEYLKK